MGSLEAERRAFAALPNDEARQRAEKWFTGKTPAVLEWDSATQWYYGQAARERGRSAARAVPAAFADAAFVIRAKDWNRVKDALGKLP